MDLQTNIAINTLAKLLKYVVLQVDECGMTIPRTVARMACERNVKLVFGPKRGEWQIKADLAKEARMSIAVGRERTETPMKNQLGSRKQTTLRALSTLQSAPSTSRPSFRGSEQHDQNFFCPESSHTPELPLDPARLALPIVGHGMESLKHELTKFTLIDDSSASDQVAMSPDPGSANRRSC